MDRWYLVELLNDMLGGDVGTAVNHGDIDSPAELGKAVSEEEALAGSLGPGQHKGDGRVEEPHERVEDGLDLRRLHHRLALVGAEVIQGDGVGGMVGGAGVGLQPVSVLVVVSA